MSFLAQLKKKHKHDPDNSLADLSSVTSDNTEYDTVVGLPSWQGGLEPDTQSCLDKMFRRNVMIGNKIAHIKATSSLIAHNRNEVIRTALKLKSRYVLFIDTDMVFPEDLIQRMQIHRVPVVSALAFTKSFPYGPNMYKRVMENGWSPIMEWDDGELLKVDCVGGACLLVETDVFRKIPGPWFAQPEMRAHIAWGELKRLFDTKDDPLEVVEAARKLYREYQHDEGVLGEDYYFSELLRRAGVPVYVDTALKIGHIGKYMYAYEDFAAQMKAGKLDKFVDLGKVVNPSGR